MTQYFLDPEGEIPSTPLNMYNYALDLVRSAEEARNSQYLEEAWQSHYHSASTILKEALLFGQAGAAAILAYLYCHGYGVRQDFTKVKLYIFIGFNLNDDLAINYLEGRDDEFFSIKPFLQTTPVYSEELMGKAIEYSELLVANSRDDNLEISLKTLSIVLAIFEEIGQDALNIFDPLPTFGSSSSNEQTQSIEELPHIDNNVPISGEADQQQIVSQDHSSCCVIM